jgi:hypothetical protein
LKTATITLTMALLCTFGYGQDASKIYKSTVKSTVTIETGNSIGSGFFVAPNIIATNYHVVAGASYINASINGTSKKYRTTSIAAVDRKADLILFNVSGANAAPLPLSPIKVEIGQQIYVIGSPKGLEATISDGIISGRRNMSGNERLQISAPISPGSSGGPVINAKGEVIGISVSQMAEGQNLNFAIPVNKVKELLAQAKKGPSPPLAGSGSSINRDPHRGSTAGKTIYAMNGVQSNNGKLSLNYIERTSQYSTFHFTYSCEDCPSAHTIWLDNYRLVDRTTGKTYHAYATNLPNENTKTTVQPGSSTEFMVQFKSVPSSVKVFSLKEGQCEEGNFCFPYVSLTRHGKITSTKPVIRNNKGQKGTVTFYSNYGKSGHIKLWVDGKYKGKLTNYFKNNATPDCGGEGTLSFNLPEGTYRFKAEDNSYKWVGTVKVAANSCVLQGLVRQ